MIRIEEAIKFLGTDIISVTFTPKGLSHLSLKPDRGSENILLKDTNEEAKVNSTTKKVIDETLKFLETGSHNMPLDFSSFSDFRQRVFAVVSEIEPGEVVTYKKIAEMLGKPGAAQAVGSAIAKNPVSYFLPSHRVLPQKGIGICRSGAGHLRERLLAKEGHDISRLRGNYICTRKKCCFE